MPLQAHIEAAAFDALPDVTVLGKDSFVKNEKEGKFFLNLPADEAGKLAFNLQESNRKLQENNADLLRQKGEANAKAKPWESFGKTPDEIRELLESKRPEDITALVAKHNADLDAMKTSFAEAEKQKAAAIEALQRQLAETNTKATISRLRADYDLDDTAEHVLSSYIRSEPKEEGSLEFVTRVYDNGSPALLAGEPMTPDQLIKSFREAKKYNGMFQVGSGEGTGSTSRQGTAATGKHLEGLTGTALLQAARRGQ